jgi:hypothetical protein
MKKFFILYLSILICIISISIFLSLKQKFLEFSISKLYKEIYANRGEYQNLKAEWNYLNNKNYLKMLVNKYLPNMSEQPNKSDSLVVEKIPIR